MSRPEIYRHLKKCRLCPRSCGVDRSNDALGFCGAGKEARLASATVHIGEEPPISGTKGSGTFFFSRCTLSCLFCQNFPISQLGHGKDISVEALAERMYRLAGRGAHNINIVTGTHFAPHIVAAVQEARERGMNIPVVWNTSGYESPDTLKLLKGTVDIYLTDIKYADDAVAQKLSGPSDYFAVASTAAAEMLAQVGPLKTDSRGIGVRGVIIRHLVLPQNMSQTQKVMQYIRRTFGKKVPVSLMGQYFPAHRAGEVPELTRPLTREEYEAAERAAVEAGIEEGWFQDMKAPEGRRGA